jgi:hypothetical protein
LESPLFAAGLFYHRKQEAIATWLAAHLPEAGIAIAAGVRSLRMIFKIPLIDGS